MARRTQQQVVVSKASVVAQEQAVQRGEGEFLASKFVIHHECDPIPLGRDGVLSVQVYSYNGSLPRIQIYRVGVSNKTGKTWQVKELKPMTATTAADLGKALAEASTVLHQLLTQQQGKVS